jgi:hypothetical protein
MLMYHPDQNNYASMPRIAFPEGFPTLRNRRVRVRLHWHTGAGGNVYWRVTFYAIAQNVAYPGAGGTLGTPYGVPIANAHLFTEFEWGSLPATYNHTTQLVGHVMRLGGDGGDTCSDWSYLQAVEIKFG